MAAEPAPELGTGAPDEAARRLYLEIVAKGGQLPISAVTAADRPAIDQLVATGLLMPNWVDGWFTAVSPRRVSERLSTRLRGEATRLLAEAEALPGVLEGLTRAYEAKRGLGAAEVVEYVEGTNNIRHRITELVSECKYELLTAQPGPRDPEIMALARRQDLEVVRRGARMRTLYQSMVLSEPFTVDYAVEMSRHGSEIRVLDEPFERMIVIDRAVAVTAAADDHRRAVFLTDPASVNILVKVFERDWAKADVVQWGAAEDGPDRVLERVGRLLAQGLTQRAVASRLGLSERTVAGHISRLRERYGARTLFQLGWLMRGGRGE